MCNCLRIVYLLAGVVAFGAIEQVFAQNADSSGVELAAAVIRTEDGKMTVVSIDLNLVGDKCVEAQVYSEIQIRASKRLAGVNSETPAIQLCPRDRTGMYQQFIRDALPKGACITTVARRHASEEVLAHVKNCLE